MPLELRQVTSATEVPEIVRGWIGNEALWTRPLESVDWKTSGDFHKDRIEDLSARHWFRHSITPGSVWLKVVDTDVEDKVIAASRWIIHTNAALKGPAWPTGAYWLAPGPERTFYEAIRSNFAAVRNDPVRQSHVHLATNYTLAEHRRRGANTLMVEWGTKKADELGLETWLEATALGSTIYTKHSFELVRMVEMYPSAEPKEDNDQWRHWADATQDFRLAVMRRPVNGVWVDEGGDAAPFPAQDLVRNLWLKEVGRSVVA